jgi:hypothetical protein
MSPAIFGVALQMHIAKANSNSRRFIVFRGVLIIGVPSSAINITGVL